jgi:GT2 family glycosyltransferase
MKKIALITINYNRGKITHEFLKSVAKLKNTPDYSIGIFVIDNGSKEILKLTKDEKELGNIKFTSRIISVYRQEQYRF